jgi:triphosphoribosyl-dephospho-CoA synthase
MTDPLTTLARLAGDPSSSVRWACLLECMAPKAGNVYPGRPFCNLTYTDFVAAAEITATEFARSAERISTRMQLAVERTVADRGSNVNLGIVLLLGPLVAADEALLAQSRQPSDSTWKSAVSAVLAGFDGSDGRNVYRAIDGARAGGLGTVDELDVHGLPGPVNLVQAMKLAEHRDRVARQYATDFSDLIDHVVPVVRAAIAEQGDLLQGIRRAHVQLLRTEPDSLIARKNGIEVASAVQQMAQEVDLDDPTSLARFDDSLRSDDHRLNPGTTADLIAAALFLLLRTPSPRETP